MRLKRLLLPAASMAVLVLAFVIVPDALAQFGLDKAGSAAGLKNPSIPTLINRILKPVLGFVGTIFLLLMVYAGFLWMTARGDAKKVDQAKQLILGAIIGVIIIASAYAITSFIIGAATGTAESTSGGGTLTAGQTCTSNAECKSGSCGSEPGTCTTTDADNDLTLCFGDEDCPAGGTCEGEGTVKTCAP